MSSSTLKPIGQTDCYGCGRLMCACTIVRPVIYIYPEVVIHVER